MPSDFRLGAYLKGTAIYVKPDIAEKKDENGKKNEWTCPVCETRADLKKGDIKVHHFAHHVKKSCSYFERPGESDLHKAAKEEIKNRYEGGAQFKVVRKCHSCHCRSKTILDTSLLNGMRRAINEDPYDPTNKRLHSDVSLYHDGKLNCIVEIVHTHTTEQRPEPWVEIKAIDVIENTDTSGNITFYCKRQYTCSICEAKEKERLAEQIRIREERERKEKERLAEQIRIRREEKREREERKEMYRLEASRREQDRIRREEINRLEASRREQDRIRREQDRIRAKERHDEEMKEMTEMKIVLDKELSEKAKQEWDEKYERERLASGYDTFYRACHNGNINDVTRHLETIDINRKAKDGRTALMTACEEGHIDLVRFLLKRGAQIKSTMTSWDYNGTTALDFAKRRGNTEIVLLLEEALQEIPVRSQ
jgi:hypothetical protein